MTYFVLSVVNFISQTFSLSLFSNKKGVIDNLVLLLIFRVLQENILTVPNLLSVSRIALSPALGYLVLSENYPLALGLFAVAGVTDMVCACACGHVNACAYYIL